ncbi:MAG: DUF983 domain-containing protein [Segetibacter sp.]
METIITDTLLNNINMSKLESTPSALNLLKCKCPRCRKGDMLEDKNPGHLRKTMKMNKECPLCRQPLDIEVGFYFGSSYVGYALTVALTVATFVAWWVLIGFSLYNNRIFYCLALNAILLIVAQPYLMRVSRTGWLSFFVKYDKNWRTNPPQPLERTNKDQENNW